MSGILTYIIPLFPTIVTTRDTVEGHDAEGGFQQQLLVAR